MNWTADENAMSARKALSAARTALERGRDRDALRLYELVLAKEALPGARRAESLYESGILQASPDPAIRNLANARNRLEEFGATYPRHERRVEAATALALIEGIESAVFEAEALRGSIVAKDLACAGEKEGIESRLATSSAEAQALETQVQTQRSEIQSLRSEAQALRAEIEKRDEALRKVKDALVGRRRLR